MKSSLRIKRTAGFTLVEIMIVVAIIALLAAIAIPNFMRSSDRARLNSIYSNLRVIEGAKENWAIETGKSLGAMPDMPTLTVYFLHNVHPVVQEIYMPNAVGSPAVAQLPGTVSLPPWAPGAAIPVQ